MSEKLLNNAFDPSLPLHLFVNAAIARGLGFLLIQPMDNKLRPYNFIQCGSTLLTDTQKRYSIYQIEMLAIVFVLTIMQHYCFGSLETIIFTDHFKKCTK